VPGFDERKGFLFVGPVLEDYCPNADAVERLVCGIFPAVKSVMGSDAQLCLVGYQGSQRIRELMRNNADPQIQVTGQVPEVDAYLHQARVFVAPTRYAAGIPNKVLEAAAHGLPVVATSLLATQLGWQAGSELLVADSDEEISAACTRLHEDAALWTRVRDGARRRIRRDHDPAAISTALRALLGPTTAA
jgi:glycosyltransferase involved in cell wall biosynthesis